MNLNGLLKNNADATSTNTKCILGHQRHGITALTWVPHFVGQTIEECFMVNV